VPLPDADRLAKMVPASIGITLDAALHSSRELREMYAHEDWARQTIDIARRLEGICRNASTHAAGVVIAPGPLQEIVPLQRSTTDKDASMQVTQFDMDGVQRIGLLKMDFLGLTNLSVIEETLDNIEQATGTRLDIDALPLDDAATYELLGRADTHGVFQLEAVGGKRILIDMQPRSLEDLSAAVALNRPGPIEGGVIDLYMKRRRGEVTIEYPPGLAPFLEPILRDTHGTIVYQDQVMRIAQAVAGFSLGEADVLRAAMGKKDKAKMAKQREKFLAGAATREVPAEVAGELFELIAFFAGYGFNAAHSFAYALIAYQTAYLKANHPLEYMAALLNSKAGDFDRLQLTIRDCHARGLSVQPPDINRSGAGFSVGDRTRGEILYGLRHIKNVGEKVIENALEARAAEGPFRSLLDLCLRAGGRDLNRRVIEALICSGACDALGERAALLAAVDRVMDRATQIRVEREMGQTSLFGLPEVRPDAVTDPGGSAHVDLGAAPASFDEVPLPSVAAASVEDRLRWERDLLGMYLSDHPLRRIADVLHSRVDTHLGELGAHLEGLVVQVGGAVRELRSVVPRRSTTGARMAFLQLEDLTGSCEVVVFARVFEDCAELLRNDQVVVVRGRVEVGQRGGDAGDEQRGEGEAAKIIAESIRALDDPRLLAWRAAQTVHLTIREGQSQHAAALRETLERHQGETAIIVHVEHHDKIDEVMLPAESGVAPSPGLERAVAALLGEGGYRVEVHRERAVVSAARRGAPQPGSERSPDRG